MDGGGPGITVTLTTAATNTTPIDWSRSESQYQPPSIPNNAWSIVWNNFTASVGSTEGQLQSTLVSDTAYLNQVGIANPTVSQLLAFELLRADADLPVATLAGTTDISFPAGSGLSLDFSRPSSCRRSAAAILPEHSASAGSPLGHLRDN